MIYQLLALCLYIKTKEDQIILVKSFNENNSFLK